MSLRMDNRDLAKFIRERIFHATQTEMASIAGVHQSNWSLWEKQGADLRLSHIRNIRAAAIDRGLPWKDEWLFNLPDEASETMVSE
jgi:hypothetical protein